MDNDMNETRLSLALNLTRRLQKHPTYWHAIQWDLTRRPCRCFVPPVSHTWKGTKGHGHSTRLFTTMSSRLRPLYRIHYSANMLTMSIAITVHLFNVGRDALIIKAPVTLMAVIIEYAVMKPDRRKASQTLTTLGSAVPTHLWETERVGVRTLTFELSFIESVETVHYTGFLIGVNWSTLWKRIHRKDKQMKESRK